MQAIEFQTILHNGIVTLPPEYSVEWEGKSIRVIVLESTTALKASSEPTQGHITPEGDQFAPTHEQSTSNSLLSYLKQIKITAPADFSENLDAYLSGEKNV
jgi:hypothetical protein